MNCCPNASEGWDCECYVEELDAKYSKLKILCEKLIKVNEFYASPARWRSEWPNKGEHVIGDTDNISRGGKRAREIAKDETYQEILKEMR